MGQKVKVILIATNLFYFALVLSIFPLGYAATCIAAVLSPWWLPFLWRLVRGRAFKRWQRLRIYPGNGVVGIAVPGNDESNDSYVFIDWGFAGECRFRVRSTATRRAIRFGFSFRPVRAWLDVEGERGLLLTLHVYPPGAKWGARRLWLGQWRAGYCPEAAR